MNGWIYSALLLYFLIQFLVVYYRSEKSHKKRRIALLEELERLDIENRKLRKEIARLGGNIND